MQLWTDYEGLTIDGAFPLKRLLLPEGRSAFFSTANGKGDSVVLRLIECHFDEEEILARWRCLEALNHPGFLKLERFGQIELDGSPAVYAVFEKVDANLADPLQRGHLSVKETAQIAACLLPALEMLHTHGFVHEHVEPRNVFAVGDAVKLRSDCIREAPEGDEGRQAKQRDVHDLAVTLLQTLTLCNTLDGVREAELPAPFGDMVRNGISGAWGLAEMSAALQGRSGVAARVKPPVAPAAPSAAARQPAAAAPPPRQQRTAEENTRWDGNVVRSTMRQEIADREEEPGFSLRARWTSLAAMVVLLVLVGGWMLHHALRGHASQAAAASASGKTTQGRVAGNKAAAAAAAPRAGLKMPAAEHAAAGPRSQWRVIAYTYDHQNEAQKKAAAIAGKHPNLHPQVFAPRGHAPYLVAVGGVMTRDQAYALARRARGMGLPRDTYAQNY
jgi:eukaryotic-like serine/threonine-protein kinase